MTTTANALNVCVKHKHRTAQRTHLVAWENKRQQQNLSNWVDGVHEIWNIQLIRCAVLDFCEVIPENTPLLLAFANKGYMTRRLKTITKWDLIQIQKMLSQADCDLTLENLVELMATIKTLCGYNCYKTLLHSQCRQNVMDKVHGMHLL